MDYYVSVGLIAVAALLSGAIGLPIIKIIQLSGYKARGVVAWWKATAYDAPIRYFALMLLSFIASVVFVGCFSSFEYVRYCAVLPYVILCAVFLAATVRNGNCNAKFTGRVKRLFALNMLISLIPAAGVAWATYYSPYCQTLAAALGLLAPFTVIAANAVTSPFERLNNKKYVKRAKRKLAEQAPIVIGITGSFGKTTAKNMLAAMLGKKYTVLATPGSFNTPMGVCLTVNNELDGQQVFIAEMGARYKGDIAELCAIASPKYGVITSVGDMHLETLKSREGVANAKFELGGALPADGLLVLNGYNADCAALGARDTACKKLIASNGAEASAESVVIDGNGTSFELTVNGETRHVCSKLLGAHVAELAAVCAAVASALGVSADDIAAAVAEMPPVEHRLQLVPSADSEVTVIDDAYNSNPVGAKNALAVLDCFDAKKIIITPGFVELGTIEKQCNTELGAQIAAVCDYAFLVGSRATDIKKGALGAGMNESAVSVFGARDEAVAALKEITGKRAILFENDLPDNIK